MGFVLRVPGPVGPPPADPPRVVEFPRCGHERTEVRKRVQQNGLFAVRQCLLCGSNCGAVKKTAVGSVTGLPPWDEQLARDWQEQARSAWQAARDGAQAERDAAWRGWYEGYLRSPAWAAKRAAVMTRAGRRCEGCLARPATQVHHLTYARVGREMLFDLVAVCDACHDQIHEDKAGTP